MQKNLCWSRDNFVLQSAVANLKIFKIMTEVNKEVQQMYKNNSNSRYNRRRLATIEGTKFDLKEELPLMFKAFKEAHELYEEEVVNTPPLARVRGFEASLLNSKMLQCIQQYFPNNWKFGKYKRFTLRLNGYIILFKKLNGKNRPMNVNTKSVQRIAQQYSLPLFNEETYVEEPILFFGYRKNKVGVISEPKLVYIDEDQVKWIITDEGLSMDHTLEIPRTSTQQATPTLKKGKKSGKQAG